MDWRLRRPRVRDGDCREMGMTTTPEHEAERAAIVAWLRRDVGGEATRLRLAAAMPGGTRTERTKAAAFADGIMHAVGMMLKAVERGDYRSKAND